MIDNQLALEELKQIFNEQGLISILKDDELCVEAGGMNEYTCTFKINENDRLYIEISEEHAAIATKEQIETVKNFCRDNRIVETETRFGDGRNWDYSYESQKEITDDLVRQLVDLIVGQ